VVFVEKLAVYLRQLALDVFEGLGVVVVAAVAAAYRFSHGVVLSVAADQIGQHE
jgi:hypothetical protein